MSTNGLDELRRKLLEARAHVEKGDLRRASSCLDDLLRDEVAWLSPRDLMARASTLQQYVERRRLLRINRIALLALIFVAGLLLIVLIQTEVSYVDIDAEIHAAQLRFRPGENLRLNSIRVASVDLSGMDRVSTFGGSLLMMAPRRISGRSVPPSEWIDFPCPDCNFELTPASPQFSVEVIGPGLFLDYVQIDTKEEVSLAWMIEGTRRLRLGPVYGELRGEIQPGDTLELRSTGASWTGLSETDFLVRIKPQESVMFAAARGGILMITVAGPGTGTSPLSEDFDIESLSIFDDDRDRIRSTLSAGRIRFRNLSMEEIDLRPGDGLTLKPTDSFRVTRLSLDSDLGLRLTGRASTLRVNGVSRLPSLLEWAHQSNGLLLYVGAFSSFISFVWLTLKRLELVRV